MTIHEQARRGFGRGAAAYERGRPGYPAEAIAWLLTELELGPGRTVVDVGAGTGKLTRELVGRGASVLAVEPVSAMRAMLEQAVPGVRALDGKAERLPIEDRTVDAVIVAQAFHWFDAPKASAEFHRVLRPRGRLALIWNRRQLDQPLHRQISAIIAPYRGDTPTHYRGEWRQPITADGLFVSVGEFEVPYEQVLDVDGVVDRVCSTSFIGSLPEPERDAVLSRVRELAERAEPPLRLGYLTEAYVYERT